MKKYCKVGPLLALLVIQQASASNVGNFDGSLRSWNSGDMGITYATAIAAGHTIEADESISAVNLANDTHFVLGEPTVTPGGTQLADLSAWVQAGGILLLYAESNGGLPALNNIALGIGSSLAWGGSISSGATFVGGNFATEGPPYNLVGQSLSTTKGTPVMSGGTPLAGDYIRFEQLGAGYVFGFADRSDHNFFAPTAGNANGQLILNILNSPGHQGHQVPDSNCFPIVWAAVGTGLLIWKHNRRTTSV